jgi:hypothetical protein
MAVVVLGVRRSIFFDARLLTKLDTEVGLVRKASVETPPLPVHPFSASRLLSALLSTHTHLCISIYVLIFRNNRHPVVQIQCSYTCGFGYAVA